MLGSARLAQLHQLVPDAGSNQCGAAALLNSYLPTTGSRAGRTQKSMVTFAPSAQASGIWPVAAGFWMYCRSGSKATPRPSTNL